MFCTYCGNPIEENQKICSKCNNKIDWEVGERGFKKPSWTPDVNNELLVWLDKLYNAEQQVLDIEFTKNYIESWNPEKAIPYKPQLHKIYSSEKEIENACSSYKPSMGSAFGYSFLCMIISAFFFNFSMNFGTTLMLIGWAIIWGIYFASLSSYHRAVEDLKAKNIDNIHENKKLNEKYERKVEQITIENERLRVLRNSLLDFYQDAYDSSAFVLKELYNDSGIYSKYHSFPAICYMKEIVESGMVFNLGDAYKELEMHLHFSQVVAGISNINQQLFEIADCLKSNFGTLTRTLNENKMHAEAFYNSITKEISEIAANQEVKLDNIIDNQLIANKKSDMIAQNTDALKFIKNSSGRTLDMSYFINWYDKQVYNNS